MAFKMKRPTFYYGSSKMKPALYQKKQEDFEPAYEGGDYSFAQLAGMSDAELKKKYPDSYKKIMSDLIKKGYRKKKGTEGPVKEAEK
tara:strand:+ start:801 stop:1061 length:261 start_codon:yes stop_codon:yes gene_type:complete